MKLKVHKKWNIYCLLQLYLFIFLIFVSIFYVRKTLILNLNTCNNQFKIKLLISGINQNVSPRVESADIARGVTKIWFISAVTLSNSCWYTWVLWYNCAIAWLPFSVLASCWKQTNCYRSERTFTASNLLDWKYRFFAKSNFKLKQINSK